MAIIKKNHKGSDSYDDQIQYIEEKFKSLNTNPNKVIYIHETCATDTNQVKINSKNIKQRKKIMEKGGGGLERERKGRDSERRERKRERE